MKTVRIYIIVLLLPLTALLAGTNGILEGLVIDKVTNQPLPGATVFLRGTNIGGVTDMNGRFSINNIPAGVYTVQSSFVGYHTIVINGVDIKPDLKTKLTVGLQPTSVELPSMTITAERPPIQKDVTGTMYSVNENTFTALPVNSIQDVLALQPGVTLENNVRGGKTTEVLYLIDGLPVQNVIDGGAGSELSQSAIGSLSMQTGGFDPEYGNALSGVVNIVTRRGGDSLRLNVRAEKDDMFGGKQFDRRNELELSAGGPLREDLFYFASANALFTDTRFWQEYQRFFSSPVEKSFHGFAKLDYLYSQPLRVSAQLLYSNRASRDYEYSWRYNLSGLPDRFQQGYRAALIVSHTVSESFFYTASLSRYVLDQEINSRSRSAIDTTMYTWDFFLQYIVGGNRSWRARKQQVQNLAKADITWRMNEHHLFKIGGEVTFQEIYADVLRYEPQVNIYGKPFVNKPLLNQSTDYEYFPRNGSAYIQDKIELSNDGMLLNLGMRYEFLDPRASRPLVERVSLTSDEYQTNIVGSAKATIKHLFSPRIGFAAPFAESGYLFINYGQYYQFPLFDYLYSGLNNVALKKNTGALVGNPDLKPEVTRSWEMSLKYALKNDLVLSATYFHKETENQVDIKTFVPTNARVAGDYGFAEFVNNPFASSNGIELLCSKENGDWLTGSVSYTYMVAEGVSENARDGLQYYQWGVPSPTHPFPLSWDQRHTLKAVAFIQLPWDISASASWMFHTGRPYTFYPSKDGFTPDDPLAEFEPNNARMSDFSHLNMKISRQFIAPGTGGMLSSLVLYIDARNLLNDRNVLWLDSGGKIGGELGDISAWDNYRRIRVGVTASL